jgi:hypothetical protein
MELSRAGERTQIDDDNLILSKRFGLAFAANIAVNSDICFSGGPSDHRGNLVRFSWVNLSQVLIMIEVS